MELPIVNDKVVDFLLVYMARDSLPPYDFMLLMVALFGVACWFSLRGFKQIRKKERHLRCRVQELERQIERDKQAVLRLKSELRDCNRKKGDTT